MKPLTLAQARVIETFRRLFAISGIPPTMQEIADEMDVSKTIEHLRAIAKKGYLRMTPGEMRSIQLVGCRCPACGQEITEDSHAGAVATGG